MARARSSPRLRAIAKPRSNRPVKQAAITASQRTQAAPARPARKQPAAARRTTATQTARKTPTANQTAAARQTTAKKTPAATQTAKKTPTTTQTAKKTPAARERAATQTIAARSTAEETPAGKRTPSSTAAATGQGAARQPARRPGRKPPAARLSGGSSVVKVLESRQPIEALRKFLARIADKATMEQGQIALGSAQLMLLPIAHEHRGGDEVKQLLDMVLARWDAFPDRSGFHAQEFLRNAFAAVGDDRDRIARLSALVPPDATSELRFNMAGAYAVSGDRPAMLRALEAALAIGATAAQVRRDPDLARFADDPAVAALLDRAAAPAIPVDVAPYIAPVHAALDSLIAALRDIGGHTQLQPPATLDAVLAAERASRIQLPNDYRALLTISDGAVLWDHELFGTSDLRGDTPLAHRAREFLTTSAQNGGIGMDACVALASWGQSDHWLLYDPRGVIREGTPGYVVMLADPLPIAGLADALRRLEDAVRDVLATN